MQYWLLKTEPAEYSYDDLERAGQDMWDGVRNGAAQKNMRAMQPGDLTLIYHTGNERAMIGVAEVVSPPYPDPTDEKQRAVAVDVAARGRLPRPISLAEVKRIPAFADWELVRQPRLSVVPVHPDWWSLLMSVSTH